VTRNCSLLEGSRALSALIQLCSDQTRCWGDQAREMELDGGGLWEVEIDRHERGSATDRP
jgi:hypothetical protein